MNVSVGVGLSGLHFESVTIFPILAFCHRNGAPKHHKEADSCRTSVTVLDKTKNVVQCDFLSVVSRNSTQMMQVS